MKLGYQIAWYSKEDCLLFVKYYGLMDIQLVNEVNQKIYDLLEAAAGKVNILVDVIGIESVKITMKDIADSDIVAKTSVHRNLHWVLYYNKSNRFYIFLASYVGQNFGERVNFFESQDEALTFMKYSNLIPDEFQVPATPEMLAASAVQQP